MTLYADSNYPVPPDIDALHSEEIDSFAAPGTWGSAAQRTAIAATVRAARAEAGIQESIGDEALCDAVDLPAPAKRLAREVALGGINVDREYCQQVQAEGVTEGAYVEIVGVASRLVNLDVFARGLGVPARALKAPVENGTPTFERPDDVADEGFFTASVPNLPHGGETAKALYGDEPAGNILRTLSLVPSEAKLLIRLVGQQYLRGQPIMNFDWGWDGALTRAQIEIVATKISAHNQCFY